MNQNRYSEGDFVQTKYGTGRVLKVVLEKPEPKERGILPAKYHYWVENLGGDGNPGLQCGDHPAEKFDELALRPCTEDQAFRYLGWEQQDGEEEEELTPEEKSREEMEADICIPPNIVRNKLRETLEAPMPLALETALCSIQEPQARAEAVEYLRAHPDCLPKFIKALVGDDVWLVTWQDQAHVQREYISVTNMPEGRYYPFSIVLPDEVLIKPEFIPELVRKLNELWEMFHKSPEYMAAMNAMSTGESTDLAVAGSIDRRTERTWTPPAEPDKYNIIPPKMSDEQAENLRDEAERIAKRTMDSNPPRIHSKRRLIE